jgi:hypothetical protein
MPEFSCDVPPASLLLGSLGLGPLGNLLAMAFTPWKLHELDMIVITAALPTMPSIMVPLIDIQYALALPDIPFVTFGLDMPELPDISLQLAANLEMSLALKMMPFNIVLGVLNFEIDTPIVFPDIIFDFLPDVPGIEILADCCTGLMEPLFTVRGPTVEESEAGLDDPSQTIFAPTDI